MRSTMIRRSAVALTGAAIVTGVLGVAVSPAQAASTRSYEVRQDCQPLGAAQSVGANSLNSHGNFYYGTWSCFAGPS